MASKEVQANSVIYSRKDYIMTLENALRAFSILKVLREAQITEWKSDTEAREADLERMLVARYTADRGFEYSRYLDRLKKPVVLPWWKKMLGIKPVPRVDEYGSAVAYTSARDGTNFEEYKARKITEAMPLYFDRVDLLYKFAMNARDFMDNEWADDFDEVSEMLKEIEIGEFDAQFVIPRSAFDKYMAAMILANAGKLEPVESRLYPNRGWVDY